LIVGGALGNLFDRVFYGYVVDYIYVSHWPVFNLSDSAINVGVGLIFLHYFFTRNHEKTTDCN
jgi:signal peptidase II